MPRLASRFETLPEYPLATIPQKKRALAERGVDVIDLGAGGAGLAPPPKALDALAEASRTPAMQRYGFGMGLVAYREAVAAWMQQRFGLAFDPMREMVPLIGSKEGISHLALAYLETGRRGCLKFGDETVLAAPAELRHNLCHWLDDRLGRQSAQYYGS